MLLSVRMEQFGFHWLDFREISYFNIFRKSCACMFVLNITLCLPFSFIVYLIFFLLGVRQSKSFSHYVTSPADSSFQSKKKEDQKKRSIFCHIEPILRGLNALLAASPLLFFFILDSISLCCPFKSHAMLNFSVCFVPQIKVIFAIV